MGIGLATQRRARQVAAIDEGLHNVLLYVQVVVVDRRQRIAQRGEVLHRLVDAIIVDVVARRLGAQNEVIANVLLDEAVAIVAANHRVGQVHVFDLGLQLAAIMPADSAPEDDGDLVGLTDRAIGVKQVFAQFVQRRAASEDEIVAELDLREEQPMLAAGLLSLPRRKERREARQACGTKGYQGQSPWLVRGDRFRLKRPPRIMIGGGQCDSV
jgi:hypothetical protein